MRQIRLAVTLAAAAAALALSGGAGAQSASKLVVAVPFGPAAGWALETDDAYVLAKAGCLEGLTRIDFDGKLQPALAESWTQSDPTVLDITLRNGVTFQDGAKLTAQAVSDALNHVLSAAAPPRGFSPKQIKSVAALDARTVRVTGTAPSVLLAYRLASPNTGILSPAAYKDGKVNPLGACTGPFTLVEEVPQQALKLARNESYWGGPVALAEVEMRFMPDGDTRTTQVKTGEAHIAANVPTAALAGLAAAPNVEVKTIELPRTTSLYFNNKKAPLDNPKVRQAIQGALDVEAIAKSIYEGAARPAIGPFAPGEPWAPAAAPVKRDVERAKALLAAAGIKPGELKLGLLAYVERAELPDLAAVVQDQLRQVGIQVEVRVANYGALEPDMLSGNFDMTLLSRNHLSDVADPIGFLTADYTCEGGYNLSHFCDPSVDAKLAEAAAMADAAGRHAIYRAVAEKLQQEAVDVFIIHEQQSDAVGPRVQNYRIHPFSHYVLVPGLSLAAQ